MAISLKKAGKDVLGKCSICGEEVLSGKNWMDFIINEKTGEIYCTYKCYVEYMREGK